ncbi:MAG: DUF4055 domain-containing protein [Alkalispirochaeta sp.]
MPVTTTHRDYDRHVDRWRQYRDAAEGEHAVKDRGEKYLPRKSVKQTDKEYEAYKQRALYFNATGRTREGLVGLPWRRKPDIEAPDAMQPILDDATMDGITLQELGKQATEEVITVGRAGILVDYPPVTDVPASLAEYERSGNRPYATLYTAEAVTNWDETRIGNQMMLTRVVLRETLWETSAEDEFEHDEVEQYRVLDLTDEGYRQRLYRKIKKEWAVVEEYYPKMNGRVMRFIPFEFLGPVNGLTSIQKSPIADLAVVNLSHYRTMADLENGRHWCGSPTPVFIGEFQSTDGEEVTEVKLGSESGIQMTEGSEALYLEFTGAGLNELREADRQKREMMVVLGTRILAEDKRQTEAAETARIHRAGEESTLQSIVQSVTRSMTRVMEYLRDWLGVVGDVAFEINTDFVPSKMTPQELTAVVDSWQRGGLTTPDLFWQLKQGEMVRSDKTLEEHQTELEDEGPRLGLMGGGFE